ncbi:hypothetical protein D9M69_307320 [compost metagenome]
MKGQPAFAGLIRSAAARLSEVEDLLRQLVRARLLGGDHAVYVTAEGLTPCPTGLAAGRACEITC